MWDIFQLFYHKGYSQRLREGIHRCHNQVPKSFEGWNKAPVLHYHTRPLLPLVNKKRRESAFLKITARFQYWRNSLCPYCVIDILIAVELYNTTKIILPARSIYSGCYWAMKSKNIFHFLFFTYHAKNNNKIELTNSKDRRFPN